MLIKYKIYPEFSCLIVITFIYCPSTFILCTIKFVNDLNYISLQFIIFVFNWWKSKPYSIFYSLVTLPLLSGGKINSVSNIITHRKSTIPGKNPSFQETHTRDINRVFLSQREFSHKLKNFWWFVHVLITCNPRMLELILQHHCILLYYLKLVIYYKI